MANTVCYAGALTLTGDGRTRPASHSAHSDSSSRIGGYVAIANVTSVNSKTAKCEPIGISNVSIAES